MLFLWFSFFANISGLFIPTSLVARNESHVYKRLTPGTANSSSAWSILCWINSSSRRKVVPFFCSNCNYIEYAIVVLRTGTTLSTCTQRGNAGNSSSNGELVTYAAPSGTYYLRVYALSDNFRVITNICDGLCKLGCPTTSVVSGFWRNRLPSFAARSETCFPTPFTDSTVHQYSLVSSQNLEITFGSVPVSASNCANFQYDLGNLLCFPNSICKQNMWEKDEFYNRDTYLVTPANRKAALQVNCLSGSACGISVNSVIEWFACSPIRNCLVSWERLEHLCQWTANAPRKHYATASKWRTYLPYFSLSLDRALWQPYLQPCLLQRQL